MSYILIYLRKIFTFFWQIKRKYTFAALKALIMLYYKLKNAVGQSEAEQRKWQKGLKITFKTPKPT